MIIEFLALGIIAIACGIVKLTEEENITIREQINALFSGIILCISIFLCLSYFDLTYEIRIGISAIVTFIGLDKAIEYFNKFKGK